MTTANPLLFYQVAAAVMPTMLIAAAVQLKVFSRGEDADTSWRAFTDALGVLSLGVGEATALQVIKSGSASGGSRFTVSASLLLVLLVIVFELAGPRIVTSLEGVRNFATQEGPYLRLRGVLGVLATLTLAALVFVMFSALFLFMLA